MSSPNGYKGMKDLSGVDQTFEKALAGQEPDSADAASITEFVRALKAEAGALSVSTDADEHIANAAAAVPKTSPTSANKESPRKARGLRRRVVVLASAGALLLVTAGVGLANDANPNDPLYGVDLALEKMGIGDGGASERAHEVLQLLASGETGSALGHAAATVSSLPEQAEGEAANAALAEAAERLAEEGSQIPEGVPELLAHLAEHIGSGDGEAIAELARAISDAVEHGTPVVVPGPPASAPGPPIEIPGPPNTEGS